MEHNFDNLPDKLRASALFCCWKYEDRDGKKTKVPINPKTGRRGRSNDRNTFTGFSAAGAVSGKYDGIGVGVFDNLAGIDIDDCVDENGNVNKLASEICRDVKTYAELSPSGTGIHLYGLAAGFQYDKNEYYTNNQKLGIEVYIAGCTNKYLTVTGNRINEYGLEDITDVLPKLFDRYMKKNAKKSSSNNADSSRQKPMDISDADLIERIKNSRQAMKFIPLWAGDVSGYGSHSEADQALCNILAFWTGGDHSRIDQLFRQSGLFRDKWEKRDEYRNSTISNAISSCKEFYDPDRQQDNLNYSEDDLDKFHHFNKQGEPISVYDFRIYKFLCRKMNIVIIGGTPYLYRNGVFIPDQSGAKLKTAIRRLIYPHLIKSTTIDRVYRLFLGEADLQCEPKDMNRYPVHWICFKNGFYDPIEKRMIPHNPEYRAMNQIQFEYDPTAFFTGNEIDQWLEFIAPDAEDREMLLQFCGYCLTRDTRQQKFLILVGSGGTGKSTVIKMLELVIGSDNISNISLKELTQRFASYGLMGKLLNSCADLEIGALEDTSLVKKILGEDSLRAEAKGKDAISFRNYAKLIFSTNELPLVISEKTNGFFRRLLILTMNQQPGTIKPNYLNLLQTEIEYFVHLIVRALERMYEQGRIAESSDSKTAVKTLWNESDTVEAWLEDNCEIHLESERKKEWNTVERTKLYYNYAQWCADNDRKELNQTGFYRSLRLKKFGEFKSNGIRYITGISFNDSIFREMQEDERRKKMNERTKKPTIYNR